MEERQLAGYTELARLLDVHPNNVWMWYHRRERNGFPESVEERVPTNKDHRHRRAGGRPGPMFDIDEVKEWYKTYKPGRPGRPVDPNSRRSLQKRRRKSW